MVKPKNKILIANCIMYLSSNKNIAKFKHIYTHTHTHTHVMYYINVIHEMSRPAEIRIAFSATHYISHLETS